MNTQDEFIGAVYSGDVVLAERLLKDGACIGQDEILHCAAQRGNVEMLDFLLKSGGAEFIDQFDSMSLTPLTWAAKEKKISAMKLLIDAGANVNAVDERRIGNTALREVVGDGDVEVIEILLRAGADPHIPGWMQMTAVDKAKSQWENVKSERGQKVLELLRLKHTEADKILNKFPRRKSKKR
jgi:ankyrin repeat protein